MKQTTLSFSDNEILKEIYALTALRSHIKGRKNEIPLLNDDQRPGLVEVIEGAVCNITAELLPHICGCSFPERQLEAITYSTAIDLYRLTVRLPDEFPSDFTGTLRRAINQAIVFETLAMVFGDHDNEPALLYEERSRIALDNVREIINCGNTPLMRILPHF